MRVAVTISLLLMAQMALSQYSISGTVKNEEGKTLSRTTILLQPIPVDQHIRRSMVSDSAGNFFINDLPVGRYRLIATHIGYQEMISDTVLIDGATPLTNYHFVLRVDGGQLKEVMVTAKKELVKVEKGKIIFSVQNLSITSGLTAFDVLKKLPGVTIDQNENIILRGSTGVNVLIDGRMTYLSGTHLTTFLKGLSAEDLNKIELNLSPSAEFDAAGNAGIINILPKKNLQKGYALDFRTGISKGRFWMPASNISFSLRSKKLNVYGSLDYKTPHREWRSESGNDLADNGREIVLDRKSVSHIKANYYTWRFGGEYQFSQKHRISLGYHGYFDDWKNTIRSTVTNLDGSGEPLFVVRSLNRLTEPYYFDGLNFNYILSLDTLGKTIAAESHYISFRNYSTSSLATSYFNLNDDLQSVGVLLSDQPIFRQITSLKLDAELPFAKHEIKAGLKFADVRNDNEYRFDSLKGASYVEVSDMSNQFIYKEQIAAGYFSFSRKFHKTAITAGVRLEHTIATGRTVKSGIDNKRKYTQLFPSLSVEQSMKEDNSVHLSLSRRINRPSYGDLNPIRWYTDQYFYYSGNSDLLPETSWIFSTAYTLKRKYVFTLTYGHTINYINRKLVTDTNGVSIRSQPANLGRMHRVDLMASLPFQLFSFWSLQLMPTLSYMEYPISQLDGEKKLAKLYGMITAQQQIQLPLAIKMDIFTQYASPALRGIYAIRSYYYTDLGLKRSFFSKKLDVQFTLSDIFNTSRYQGFSKSDITNYQYSDKPDTRRIGVTIQYHLGGNLFKGNNKTTEEQQRL